MKISIPLIFIIIYSTLMISKLRADTWADNEFVYFDDDEASVRVSTNWKTHNLDRSTCISHASNILSKNNYIVDYNDKRAVGTMKNRTVIFRCDYPNVVFMVIAYRHRLDKNEENQISEELISAF